MSAWRYLLSSAVSNLTRRRLMNVVVIGTTALALVVVGTVLLAQQNLAGLFDTLKSETTVAMFLEEGVGDDGLDDLRADFVADGRIESATYVSSDEAMERMRRILGEDAEIVLDGLDHNPLPASFEVTLNPDRMGEADELVEEYTARPGILEVDYGQAEIRQLESMSNLFQGILLLMAVVITLVAVVIIFNAIQLSVVSRRKEIDILQLVGATRRFITTPFLLSGVVYGLLGGVIAIVLLAGLTIFLDRQLAALPFLGLEVGYLSQTRTIGLLLIGVLLGGMASVAAVYRSVRDF